MSKKKNDKKNSVLSIVGFIIIVAAIIFEYSVSFLQNETVMIAIILTLGIETIELFKKNVRKEIPILAIILAMILSLTVAIFNATWNFI